VTCGHHVEMDTVGPYVHESTPSAPRFLVLDIVRTRRADATESTRGTKAVSPGKRSGRFLGTTSYVLIDDLDHHL
jgi:hypothetical protein